MTNFCLRSLALTLPLCVFVAGQTVTAQGTRDTAPPTIAADDSTPDIEPQAVAALKRMSAYLMSLNTAQITARGSLDVIDAAGQRIQLDGLTTYKIRKPGFVIDYVSDMKQRRFIYDGKNFTIYAPATGFYATVAAPATNREVLAALYDKYGIALPLEDLFLWSDPNSTRSADLTSAYVVGTATLDGIQTDHYAFREKAVDWEVWIQRGDQPLPRKLVIVDRTQAARPTFITRLDWKVNPAFADADFTFVPDKSAKKIELATYQGPGE